MADKQKKTKIPEPTQARPADPEPVDPYTGEVEPPAEGAYQVTELDASDPGDRRGENRLMREEDAFDKLALDADADEISAQMKSFTDDEDIKAEFEERQRLGAAGRQRLESKLNEHHAMSPDLSGGDIDAAWDDSQVAGEESVGGSVPTPDQDNVDDLGRGAGLIYADEEELDSDRKVLDRDRRRWELDPRSAEDTEDFEEEEAAETAEGDISPEA